MRPRRKTAGSGESARDWATDRPSNQAGKTGSELGACPTIAHDLSPIRRDERGRVRDPESARQLGTRTQFGPGNAAAVTHGIHARAFEAQAEVAGMLDRYVADEGGLSEVPARRLDLLQNRAKVQRAFDRLSDTLDRLGLFDRRGRLRVAWLQRLEGLAGMLVRHDAILGLDRRPKRIPTIADLIREHEMRSAGNGSGRPQEPREPSEVASHAE